MICVEAWTYHLDGVFIAYTNIYHVWLFDLIIRLVLYSFGGLATLMFTFYVFINIPILTMSCKYAGIKGINYSPLHCPTGPIEYAL